jgi:hypothetical protein
MYQGHFITDQKIFHARAIAIVAETEMACGRIVGAESAGPVELCVMAGIAQMKNNE